MNNNEEQLRSWAAKELKLANNTLNSIASRSELARAILILFLIPLLIFAHSKMNGWPRTILGWLYFAATLFAFALVMYLVLWTIRTVAAQTPIRFQHWTRVILGVVWVPLTFWGCTQLFSVFIHGYG